MGLIRGLGSIGKGAFNKAANFISTSAIHPHLNKLKDSMLDDARLIGSGAKWVGSKAWNVTKAVTKGAVGAAKAINDFDDRYLGGNGKKALLNAGAAYAMKKGVSPDTVNKVIGGISKTKDWLSTSSLSPLGSSSLTHNGSKNRAFETGNTSGIDKKLKPQSIGTNFKELASSSLYPTALHQGMSHW